MQAEHEKKVLVKRFERHGELEIMRDMAVVFSRIKTPQEST